MTRRTVPAQPRPKPSHSPRESQLARREATGWGAETASERSPNRSVGHAQIKSAHARDCTNSRGSTMPSFLQVARVSLAAAAVALLIGAGAPPAEARSLDEIIKSGTIRIGVLPNSPPQPALGETNEIEGFDIDVGTKIDETMGVKPEFGMTERAQRVPFPVNNRAAI